MAERFRVIPENHRCQIRRGLSLGKILKISGVIWQRFQLDPLGTAKRLKQRRAANLGLRNGDETLFYGAELLPSGVSDGIVLINRLCGELRNNRHQSRQRIPGGIGCCKVPCRRQPYGSRQLCLEHRSHWLGVCQKFS